MGWRVWGDDWSQAAMSDTSMLCNIKFNSDVILKAIRTWIIVYNDPVFTNLNMKIYSNEVVGTDNVAKSLIATSTNSLTKAEIHTLDNGVKEIYFEFDNIALKGADSYNLVINGTGYVPTVNSWLAWMKAFPDPVYDGYTPAIETLLIAPYQLYAIGALL